MSFIDALADGIRSATCTWSQNVDSFWTSVGNLISGQTGLPPWLVTDQSAGLVQRVVCNSQTPTPLPNVPFTGGQCSGILYNVSWIISLINSSGTQFDFPGSGQFEGPISRVDGAVSPDGDDQLWLIRGATSEITALATSVSQTVFYTSFNVSRVDGMPDDCGDPEPSVSPVNVVNNITNNITYNDNTGAPVVEVVNYNFGFAYVDANAEFFIPITVDVGGISIPVRFNVSTGDISFNFGGRGGGGSGGGGDTIILEPEPPDSPDDVPVPTPPAEDPREELQIVGVMVTTTNIGVGFAGTQVDGQLAPDLYLPRLAQVLFEYRFSDGSVGWSTPLPVNNRREFVESPRPGNTIGAQIIQAPGVTAVFSIVREREEVVLSEGLQ